MKDHLIDMPKSSETLSEPRNADRKKCLSSSVPKELLGLTLKTAGVFGSVALCVWLKNNCSFTQGEHNWSSSDIYKLEAYSCGTYFIVAGLLRYKRWQTEINPKLTEQESLVNVLNNPQAGKMDFKSDDDFDLLDNRNIPKEMRYSKTWARLDKSLDVGIAGFFRFVKYLAFFAVQESMTVVNFESRNCFTFISPIQLMPLVLGIINAFFAYKNDALNIYSKNIRLTNIVLQKIHLGRVNPGAYNQQYDADNLSKHIDAARTTQKQFNEMLEIFSKGIDVLLIPTLVLWLSSNCARAKNETQLLSSGMLWGIEAGVFAAYFALTAVMRCYRRESEKKPLVLEQDQHINSLCPARVQLEAQENGYTMISNNPPLPSEDNRDYRGKFIDCLTSLKSNKAFYADKFKDMSVGFVSGFAQALCFYYIAQSISIFNFKQDDCFSGLEVQQIIFATITGLLTSYAYQNDAFARGIASLKQVNFFLKKIPLSPFAQIALTPVTPSRK